MKFYRHILPILALPGMVAVLIPALLFYFTKGASVYESLESGLVAVLRVFGILFLISGLGLLSRTIWLFNNVGKGTLAPWDPPKHFVATDVYLYTRNPMISGGLMFLFSQVLLSGSLALLGWACLFFLGKTIYFIRHEEPELEKRFGESYRIYKQNVPRWIPRLKPWVGVSEVI